MNEGTANLLYISYSPTKIIPRVFFFQKKKTLKSPPISSAAHPTPSHLRRPPTSTPTPSSPQKLGFLNRKSSVPSILLLLHGTEIFEGMGVGWSGRRRCDGVGVGGGEGEMGILGFFYTWHYLCCVAGEFLSAA